MKPRHLICMVVAIGSWLAAPTLARAGFVTIANPGNAHPSGGSYIGATTRINITAPEFSIVSSISDGTVTVGFSTPMEVLQVDNSWGSWSSPPFSEDPLPTVLYTQGLTQVTATFSQPLKTFGFELQPNPFGPFTFTATYFNGAATVGTISRTVDGDAGARLFAGVSTDLTLPFTSVRISGSQDFAIAQIRYAPEGVSAVPEPTSLMLAGIGGLLAGGYRWRRRRA